MRTLALFSMLVNLVGPGIDVALIFRIQHELHAASALAGVIMTGLSCGMVAGSMMIGRLAKRFGMGVLLLSSAIGQIFPPFILAVTNSPIVIVAAQFVTGLLLVAWNVQIKTLRQAIIPDELLGRCVSVFRLIAWIFIPVGDAAAGIVSQLFGAPCYFIIAGCVLLMVCFIAAATKIHRVSETMIPIDAPVAETGTS